MENSALKLVCSYVPNQKQRVKVGSSYSTFQNISTGVPPASVFGTVLFNVFTDDMLYFDVESEICNFADGTQFVHVAHFVTYRFMDVIHLVTSIYSCDTSSKTRR